MLRCVTDAPPVEHGSGRSGSGTTKACHADRWRARLEGMNPSTHTLNAGKNRMRVLVIGGGFAGSIAAVRLARRSRGLADITVLTPRPNPVHRLRNQPAAAGQTVAAPELRTLFRPT